MTESKEGKDRKGIRYLVILVLGILTVATYAFPDAFFGADSVFKTTDTHQSTLNGIISSIPCIIDTVRILFVAWIANMATGWTLEHIGGDKQTRTFMRLLRSLLKYVIYIAAVLVALKGWGVDTATIIASAGIITLVVGLGAQSLIADVIAGLFIVFEDDFEVGDIVVIDGWRGTVTEIGIRTTRLVDTGGNVKIVNNSKITTLINQTKKLSLAKCIMTIDYEENLPRVELIIKENLPKIKEAIPGIINGPFYKGVDQLADSSINLLFLADCNEEDIYVVQRAMNRELYLLMIENGISIPFPQVTLSRRDSTKFVDESVDKDEAKEFSDRQSEIARDKEIR